MSNWLYFYQWNWDFLAPFRYENFNNHRQLGLCFFRLDGQKFSRGVPFRSPPSDPSSLTSTGPPTDSVNFSANLSRSEEEEYSSQNSENRFTYNSMGCVVKTNYSKLFQLRVQFLIGFFQIFKKKKLYKNNIFSKTYFYRQHLQRRRPPSWPRRTGPESAPTARFGTHVQTVPLPTMTFLKTSLSPFSPASRGFSVLSCSTVKFGHSGTFSER